MAGVQDYRTGGPVETHRRQYRQNSIYDHRVSTQLRKRRSTVIHVSQAENNALANPATVFETSPVYEGTLMTTHRGKCVDCHIETVGSFFRMASRKTALTPPLLKAVDAFADERDLRKFRDFVGECRSNALPDGVPKKGERSRE